MADSVPGPTPGSCHGPCVIFDSGDGSELLTADLAGLGYDLIDARRAKPDLDAIIQRPESRTQVCLWLSPGADMVKAFGARALSAEATADVRAVEATESLPESLRRLGIAGVQRLLDESRPVVLIEPDDAPAPKWRPYPVGLLPEPMQGFVRQAATALGLDPAFIAVPAVAVLAACIGNRRAISPKASWVEPAVLWAVVVAESGTGKSPALAELLRPLVERDLAAIRAHQAAMDEHDQSVAAWQAENRSERGDRPEPPRPPERLVVMDTTTEAVAARLEESPLGLLLARDELAAWFGSFDQYRAGRGADAQRWLEMYDARTLIVDRKGSRTLGVARAAVSVAGCATPAVVQVGLLAPHEEDGMLPRMLLVKPPRTPSRWTERVVEPRTAADYERLLSRLLALRPAGGDGVACRPVVLGLSRETHASWRSWYDRTAVRDAESVGFEAAVRAKARAWALRLALVVHLCRVVHGDLSAAADTVDAQSLSAGIALADWHADETLRVRAELAGSTRGGEDADLIAWLERRGGRATVRDVQRSGPRRLRKSATDAEEALDRLEVNGWGTWEEGPAPERGGTAAREIVLYVFLTAATGDTRPDISEESERLSPVAPVAGGDSSPSTTSAAASPSQVDAMLDRIEEAMRSGSAADTLEARRQLEASLGPEMAEGMVATLPVPAPASAAKERSQASPSHPEQCRADYEHESAALVAPSLRPSTAGESVRLRWADAKEVKGWPLPGNDSATSSVQS